jgi:MFS superfamily sulfate permease-like transporter
MSEEANREATRTSNIALYIAIAALIAGVFQTIASILHLGR